MTCGTHRSQFFKSTLRYALKSNTWDESAPKVNQARFNHSSCILGKNLYIFGGRDASFATLSSIEVLILPDGASWSIFTDLNNLPTMTRSVPLMVPLSDKDIFISGGFLAGGQLSDVIILDTKSQSAKEEIDFSGLPFVCHG